MQITQLKLSLFLEIDPQILKTRDEVTDVVQFPRVVTLLLLYVLLYLDVVLSQLIFLVLWGRNIIHRFYLLFVLEQLEHAWDDHLTLVVDLLPG